MQKCVSQFTSVSHGIPLFNARDIKKKNPYSIPGTLSSSQTSLSSAEVTQRQPLEMLPQRFKMVCSFITGPLPSPSQLGGRVLGFSPLMRPASACHQGEIETPGRSGLKGLDGWSDSFIPLPRKAVVLVASAISVYDVDWGRRTTLDVKKKKTEEKEKRFWLCLFTLEHVCVCLCLQETKTDIFWLKEKVKHINNRSQL